MIESVSNQDISSTLVLVNKMHITKCIDGNAILMTSTRKVTMRIMARDGVIW